MSLYVRVGLGMVVALVLTVLALRFFVADDVRAREHERKQRMAASGALMMAEHVRAAADPDATLAVMRERFDTPVEIVPRTDPRVAAMVGDGPTNLERDGHHLVVVALDADRALFIGPMPAFDPTIGDEKWIALGTGLGIVLVTTLLVVMPFTRRMRSLERATQRLRDGDLSARVDVAGSGSVASLGININHMAEEIERLLENQKHLLQAVSHELRTPTARIRFSLEMLETDRDDEARARRIEEIDHSLTELDSMVDELLTYVRFGAGESPELRTEPIEVAPLVAELVEETRVLGDRIQVGVVAHGDADECRIVANRRYVRRAVDNLLRNAIRHADSRVSIEYQRVGDQVLLFVNDDGAGIPKSERDRVWEPFARIDLSRSRDSGGFGLGLAIVRRIMAWHGGRAHVEDSLLGGAMFVTSWPVDPELLDDDDES